MKVFKLGGASISNYDLIQNVYYIMQNFKDEKILIVISAMGKMTNALEKVAHAYYEGRHDDAHEIFEKIKKAHTDLLKYLVTFKWKEAEDILNLLFAKVEHVLAASPARSFDYYYDQIVSAGELFSSTLVSFFLNEQKLQNEWIDVRNLLMTDDTFREGKIDWPTSEKMVNEKLLPLFEHNNFVITQGFIAANNKGESVTLGREGSDFTAAIFASILNAESVTIWKDVDGIMNADPKEFADAVTISHLNYQEVIEMAYYGAQVVHPKTIKPLHNKSIPLYVKSFWDLRLQGTLIQNQLVNNLQPLIIQKKKQVLMSFQSLDYSFVEGEPLQLLTSIFEQVKIKPNLTQNTAISLLVCLDDSNGKIEEVALKASQLFDVQVQKNLTLLTIRHYNNQVLADMSNEKQIVLEQKTKETVQLLF